MLELVAPAESLEELRIAVCCGIDAVYLPAERFGLRPSRSKGMDYNESKRGQRFHYSQKAE